MKKLLLALVLLACGISHADTTANLVDNNNWSGVTYGTDPNNCCSNPAGSRPLYDIPTDTIKFSYGLSTVEQVWAVNQALQNSGVQINGYNWSYELQNNNSGHPTQSGIDTITSYSYLTDAAGNVVLSNTLTHNTKFAWATFSGTQTLATPTPAAGTLGIRFTGRDGGNWAGLYGPEVRNVSMSLNYTVDQCSVDPQSSPSCPGFKTYYQMWDDGYAQVDLPFAFPFYGQVFTTSYMYTNGVVGFLNNNWGFCCDGRDMNLEAGNTDSPWNYAIYALNTDLIPGPNSEFYTQVTDDGQGLRYSWVNVPEIGTSLNNTFHVQIKDTGYIGITYDQVNLNQWRQPTIGIAGNISNGEYNQYWWGPARDLPNLTGTTITFTGTETTDICKINPLHSTTCAGYTEAYYNQQCSYNALYDSGCPGYAEAYYSQQCSINQLYDVGCPGYAQAYLDYQCNLDSLYSTSCTGYAQAYYDQQCTLDPFYDTGCTEYQTAVAACTADPLSKTYCPGHQTAVTECSANGLTHAYCPSYALEQQLCSLDPLSNNLCTGYTTAVTECSTNQLLHPYCTGYITALAACATDPQSNTMCPGYSTVTASSTAEVTTVEVTISDTGVVATTPSATGDATVDSVINTTTSVSPATSATAAVTLAPNSPAATETVAVATKPSAKEEKKAEAKTESKSEAKAETKTEVASTSAGEKKETKKQSLREQIAAKRKEAAMNSAVAAGEKASEELDNATSMAAQVAVQNVVMAAMGFTPGFQAYNVIMPDGVGYKPYQVYPNQVNVDNARTLRRMSGASDRLHAQMVDQQWELAK